MSVISPVWFMFSPSNKGQRVWGPTDANVTSKENAPRIIQGFSTYVEHVPSLQLDHQADSKFAEQTVVFGDSRPMDLKCYFHCQFPVAL